VATLPAALREQLDLHAIGAGEPPGGDRDPAREHGLQRPLGRQLLEQRRLKRGKLNGVLVRQHDVVRRAHAVIEGVQ
jgi:hypothetical protein